MKIIISGIDGFFGNSLKEYLKNTSHEIYGIGKTTYTVDNIKVFASNSIDSIEIIPDVIIIAHAAVSSGSIILPKEQLLNVNVILTEDLVKKFKDSFIVYLSSVSIYDATNNHINEDSTIFPQSDYAFSKLWAEGIIRSNSYNYVIIRLSSLFGIGMKESTMIPNYINQALSENIINVWGNGSRFQNYFHITDAVKLVVKCIEKREKVNCKTILGVDNKEYTNLEIAKYIAEITFSKIQFVNSETAKSSFYDNKKTNKILNFKTRKDLMNSIKEYILWKKK